MADVRVEVWQLVLDEEGHDVLLLRDEQGRILPIRIGRCEAAAILVRLSPDLASVYVRRPWSHDLIQSMLDRLGARLDRVVIDGFVNGTFYATLHLCFRDSEFVVDARPSDAVALMLRTPCPLLVNEEVMGEAAFLLGESEDDEEEGGWDDLLA